MASQSPKHQPSLWPMQEAQKILATRNASSQIMHKEQEPRVVFACGYGPSGRPHIGTLGEIIRTSMVMDALKHCDSSLSMNLLCFVDDMDALRRVPQHFQGEKKVMMKKHLGKPLCDIPDPDHPSKDYATVNIERLDIMVRQFDVSYTIKRSSHGYREGMYDTYLKNILEHHEEIVQTVAPLLGEERRLSYSPFLPICPSTGKVLEAKILKINGNKNTIIYKHATLGETEQSILGGQCKLQWRVDWATRWQVYKVAYEMAGKDLLSSMQIAQKISGILGNKPPTTFIYELFNDEKGHKISKSVGNGLEVEEWLRYAPSESLKLFFFKNPKRAKKLYPQMIPLTTDLYDTLHQDYPDKTAEEQRTDPLWYVHRGKVPEALKDGIPFPLLLNLVNALGSNDKPLIKNMVEQKGKQVSDERLAYACAYFQDHIKPTLVMKMPEGKDKDALEELYKQLKSLPQDAKAEEIQYCAFEVGKTFEYAPLKNWFEALYQILLGQKQGPRFGSFVFFYGLERTLSRMEKILSSHS